MASLFKNRVFCLVMGSDLLQQFGIWIRNMALLFFVMEMTQNNPVYVSLLTVVELAPIFLFSLIGGIYADRWNPKRTMITADLLTLLSIGVIALVLFYGYWPIIFVVTFISAMLSQFSQPSSAKMFKQHVSDDQIPVAIGLSQSIHSLFIILGPVVGTFIYTSFGVYISFICMMVIFACSAALLAFLPTNSPLDQKDLQTSPLEDLRTGWQFFMADDSLKKRVFGFYGGKGLINHPSPNS